MMKPAVVLAVALMSCSEVLEEGTPADDRYDGVYRGERTLKGFNGPNCTPNGIATWEVINSKITINWDGRLKGYQMVTVVKSDGQFNSKQGYTIYHGGSVGYSDTRWQTVRGKIDGPRLTASVESGTICRNELSLLKIP